MASWLELLDTKKWRLVLTPETTGDNTEVQEYDGEIDVGDDDDADYEKDDGEEDYIYD